MAAEVLRAAGTVPLAAEPCWGPEAAGSPPCLFPLPYVTFVSSMERPSYKVFLQLFG